MWSHTPRIDTACQLGPLMGTSQKLVGLSSGRTPLSEKGPKQGLHEHSSPFWRFLAAAHGCLQHCLPPAGSREQTCLGLWLRPRIQNSWNRHFSGVQMARVRVPVPSGKWPRFKLLDTLLQRPFSDLGLVALSSSGKAETECLLITDSLTPAPSLLDLRQAAC